MDTRTAAPGDLGLVEEFLRTRNSVATAADLTRWAQEHGIGGRAGAGTLARAVRLREALRALMYTNNGGPVDSHAVSVVNTEIRTCAVAPSVQAGHDGVLLRWEVRVTARTAAPDGPIPAVLSAMLTAVAEGTWSRMKACAADDCRYGFYDHTKNRSGRWCDVSGCGVRARMRAYRQRRVTSPSTPARYP